MARMIKYQVKCGGCMKWKPWTWFVESENLMLCKRCKRVAMDNPGFFKRPKKEKQEA